jgi:hypothetical protein
VFLLPTAGLLASCELLAGIDDITYSPEASSAPPFTGDVASSGSSQSGDEAQPQTTGNSGQSGAAEQSGSSEADQDVAAPSSGASSGSAQSGSTSGATATKDSGPDSTVEASEPRESSTADVSRICVPGSGGGQLPFVVDSVYAPTGMFGTGTTTTSSACTVARSSPTPKGNCHTATYTPTAGGAFAGVFWQDNFNWGTQGGYSIPPGATKITFFARGNAGGETVSFIAGYSGAATPATPCTDTIRADSMPLVLTTTWTAYTLALTGTYPDGVLGAFGWEANAPDASAPTITFYIDGIQYQ